MEIHLDEALSHSVEQCRGGQVHGLGIVGLGLPRLPFSCKSRCPASLTKHLDPVKGGRSVVVTDGYIEDLDSQLIATASGTKLHVIITRDGNPSALHRVRIPYTQLDEVPA